MIVGRYWVEMGDSGFWAWDARCDVCRRFMYAQQEWVDTPDGSHLCPYCAFRAGTITGKQLAEDWQQFHHYPTYRGRYVAELLEDGRIAFIPTKKSGLKRRMFLDESQLPAVRLLP